MIATDQPFVLLDDARRSGAAPARLYSGPVAILQACDSAEIEALFSGLRDAGKDGLHAAGYFHYEAGFAIEPRLAKFGKAPSGDAPLAWFGLFERYQEIASDAVATLLPDPAGSWLGRLQPDVSKADYAKAFEKIRDYITAGDIYQANLTFRAYARYAGHPLALYAAVRARAAAGYG
ncbi:MAG: aminodeoxychorismate synthase, component I, partial [Sphingorhabdus sp.]